MKEALKITAKSIILFAVTVWLFALITPNEPKPEPEYKGWVTIGEEDIDGCKQ
tara:strand:+ start:9322 stop:9480 length:159 start_codon:yes stop_codon:yes gene_type:complete